MCVPFTPEDPMNRYEPKSPRRLLPLGVLILAALAGCENHELPTALGPEGAVFTQVPSGPVVNSLDDVVDAEGCTSSHCSLREAIAFADNTGDAEITFAVTGTITLGGTELLIDKDLTIRSPGADVLTVSGNRQSRVFTIRGVYVTIHGLTISDGSATEGGGIAVFSGTYSGALFLRDSRVVDNTAEDLGGGIYVNHAQLDLRNSTVMYNSTTAEWARGGGIALWYGHVNIADSDVAYNRADLGGGLSNRAGTLTVATSTIAYNAASAEGGGVYSDAGSGLTTILNTTISTNEARYAGGGVHNHDGLTHISHSTITGNAVTKSVADGGVGGGGIMSGPSWGDPTGSRVGVKGSIVWGNTLDGTADDIAAGLTSDSDPYWTTGYNLIGAAGAGVTLGTVFNGTGDLTGVADARLGTLTDNGGPTRTHALLAGSPAIDVGACTDIEAVTVATDQRGVNRPQGSACDIGAFELVQTASSFTSSCTFTIHPKNGQRQVTVTWANADPGVTLIQLVDTRTVSKQMAPTASGWWSTSVKTDPTYGIWGGTSRKDQGVELVEPGAACIGPAT
jgi:CSLREA domain-containing protein